MQLAITIHVHVYSLSLLGILPLQNCWNFQNRSCNHDAIAILPIVPWMSIHCGTIIIFTKYED